VPRGQVTVRLTHEFIEDSAGVSRAYDAWALLLARTLDLTPKTEPKAQLTVKTRTGRKRRGTA